MNKLIQSIIISTVVIAPLSSLSLIADATTHHTPSHVSTVSVETTRTRKTKKVKKISKKANTTAKKQVIKRYNKKAVSAEEQPSSPKTPITPQNIPIPSTSPQNSTPISPLKSTIDPTIDNPVMKLNNNMVLPNPGAGTRTIPVFSPGSIANPIGDTSIPNPKLPTELPTGLVK
jgi:hypothetical protein